MSGDHIWSDFDWCTRCGCGYYQVVDKKWPEECPGGGNVIAITDRVRTKKIRTLAEDLMINWEISWGADGEVSWRKDE